MQGRGMASRNRMRMPLHGGRGYYGGVGPRYMDYYGAGGGYDPYNPTYGYAGDDSYFGNYGGYDDYVGYEDYDYYSPLPQYGIIPGRGRGSLPYQSAPFNAAARGSRGQRSFGSGATGARGSKRKPMIASEIGQMADMKKTNAADSWTSPPIAQQPLGQPTPIVDGYGDGEWYQDSYSPMMGQSW